MPGPVLFEIYDAACSYWMAGNTVLTSWARHTEGLMLDKCDETDAVPRRRGWVRFAGWSPGRVGRGQLCPEVPAWSRRRRGAGCALWPGRRVRVRWR